MRWICLTIIAGAALACSKSADVTPTTTRTPADAGGMDSSTSVNPGIDSGGLPTRFIDGGGGPLEARIQFNGAGLICGRCGVALAQVEGGSYPYEYEWSDPTLEGPGPHSICPDGPVDLTLRVRDMLGVEDSEFPRMVAEDMVHIECTEAPDGGAAPNSGLSGCSAFAQTANAMPDAGFDQEMCRDDRPDAGPVVVEGTARLPGRFLAGRRYQVIYDQLLPIVIGEPVTVELYGSKGNCTAEQSIGTFVLDGRWHQTLCFVADQDYERLFVRVTVSTNIFFYFEILSAVTFCEECNVL